MATIKLNLEFTLTISTNEDGRRKLDTHVVGDRNISARDYLIEFGADDVLINSICTDALLGFIKKEYNIPADKALEFTNLIGELGIEDKVIALIEETQNEQP